MRSSTEVEDLLRVELETAKYWYEIAKTQVNHVTTDIPSGLPHPDGTQRIQNASRDLRASREAFRKALNRFNDFILREKIPDDL